MHYRHMIRGFWTRDSAKLVQQHIMHGTTSPLRPDLRGTGCDWGNCDRAAALIRYDFLEGWLPVCEQCARKPVAP